MNDVIAFVQFIHPGTECAPNQQADLVPWNHGDHRRKFLCNPGWYMDGERLVSDALTFWGEWEPQSRITRIDNPKEDRCLPHVIHRPVLDLNEPVIDSTGCRQNTDPFVFHERFLYRCCHQIKNGIQTQLAHLLPGSIVLFGSCVNGLFAIDTVFVVGEFSDYCDQKGGMDFDPNLENYAKIVGVGLNEPGSENGSGCGKCSGESNPSQMRLYYGASPNHPFKGMYSFVPCKRLRDSERGWARPTLTQDDINDIYADAISDSLQMNYKLCKESTLEGNIAAWNHIRSLFAKKGYLEGVRFECPKNGDALTNR